MSGRWSENTQIQSSGNLGIILMVSHGSFCLQHPLLTSFHFDSLTLKRPRLADWHEFARLTQGNSLASVLPSAFWAQDSGFNHSDDMQGSGQTCTTHKHQQEVSEKANNKQ